MRLQIMLMNLSLLMIMMSNFKYLKDSKKLNSRIFFLLMLTSVIVVIAEYGMHVYEGVPSMHFIAQFLKAIFYMLAPVYANLSAFYAETWINGVDNYSRKFLLRINIPIYLNSIGILYWTLLSQQPFDSDYIFKSVPGFIFIASMAFPLFYIWVKLYLKRKTLDKEAILELTLISIPVALGGFIMIFYPDVPTFWSGAVISQILVFFNLFTGHSLKDSLTNLSNRRALTHDWNALINRKHKMYVGGLLIDIDHFKSINDNYGHLMGDEALKEVADILQRSRHSNDGLYRLGGDEFFVLVELDDPHDIEIIKKRMDENVSFFNQKNSYPYNLELSIGAMSERFDTITDLESFIHKIDQAMYQEKAMHHAQKEFNT